MWMLKLRRSSVRRVFTNRSTNIHSFIQVSLIFGNFARNSVRLHGYIGDHEWNSNWYPFFGRKWSSRHDVKCLETNSYSNKCEVALDEPVVTWKCEECVYILWVLPDLGRMRRQRIYLFLSEVMINARRERKNTTRLIKVRFFSGIFFLNLKWAIHFDIVQLHSISDTCWEQNEKKKKMINAKIRWEKIPLRTN